MCLDVPETLSGICEADETYIGGAWKNKKIHIRKRGSKRGRGTSKQAIFGIVSRTEGKVRVWLVPNARIATTRPKVRKTVMRGSTIFTDGFKGYRLLPRYGYRHEWVDHEAGEYVRGEGHTQTLDGYWGMLKNFLAAKGGVQRKYLYRFVGEHVWRYNFRYLSRKDQVARLLQFLTRFGGRK
jgi:transposase-like protein